MMINRVFSTSNLFFIILYLMVLLQWTPGENMHCTVLKTSVMCENAEGNFLANVRSQNIAVINIVRSTLMSLYEQDFSKFTNVTEMIIDKCEVPQSILNYTLSLKELKILRIINSNITENYLTALRKSSTLVLLSLKGNNIVKIKKDMFGYLSRLKEIDLSHNMMVAFRADAFSSVSALRKLDLSYNKLSGIFDYGVRKEVLDNISRLEEIDLSHNEILTVEGGALFGMPALRKLDISHNMIGVIGYTGIIKNADFDSLSHLEEIDLSYNRILVIEADAFESLSALRRLDLSENRLSDDFDLSALLLPAGCVFQSLVATCPEPTVNAHPSAKHQQNATTEDPLQKQRLEDQQQQQLELQQALQDLKQNVKQQLELQQTLQDLEQTLQDLEQKLEQLLQQQQRQQLDIELLKEELWQQELWQQQQQHQRHEQQEQDEMLQLQRQEQQEEEEDENLLLQWQGEHEARQQSGSRRTENGARDEHDRRRAIVTDASSNLNTGVSGGELIVGVLAVVCLLFLLPILLLLMVFIATPRNRTIAACLRRIGFTR